MSFSLCCTKSDRRIVRVLQPNLFRKLAERPDYIPQNPRIAPPGLG
jgi:hypothetical protein